MAFSGAFTRPFRPVFDAGLAVASGNGLLNSLIAYWPLNEAAGANNALDLHANALTLTQVGSPGSAAGIVYAGARAFDGTARYFSRASSALTQTGDVDFTLAAWVYVTAAANGGIVAKHNATPEYNLYVNSSSFWWNVRNGVSDSFPVTLNAWSLVIVGHDAINNRIFYSKNNANPTTKNYAHDNVVGNDSFVMANRSGFYTSGRIGPVAMWKSAAGGGGALDATKRAALWNAGAGLAYSAFTT